MKIEIRKPELVQRINAHMQTGRYRDFEDLIEKALDALDEKTGEQISPDKPGKSV